MARRQAQVVCLFTGVLLLSTFLLFLFPASAQLDFVRGDCNGNGFTDVADPVFLLRFVLLSGAEPGCHDACDADDDNLLSISDALYGLGAMCGGGPPLPAPFPDCGADLTPGLGCRVYDCTAPTPPTPEPAYFLEMTAAGGDVGDVVQVSCVLDSSRGAAVEAWSWGVCHDPSLVEIQSVENGSALSSTGLDFVRILVLNEGWTTCVLSGPLAPRVGLELHVAEYSILDDVAALLRYCDTLGSPSVPIILVEDGQSLLPTTCPGGINGGAPSCGRFRRGDADADGRFSGLVDGLFMLKFEFVAGSPAPPCLKAADFDDDGRVNGVLDGLGALNLQFVPGSPPAPPPGPFACGFDPTGDGLDCLDYPTCL